MYVGLFLTDFTEHIFRALSETEIYGACAECKNQKNCWAGGRSVKKIFEAAMQSEREEDLSIIADAYTDILSGKLCSAGKDSLILHLMGAMHLMNHPPLFVPHMEQEDEDE